MKIGMNIRIDVSKLDKARFYKGSKGTYADLTAFIDTEQEGKYGDNGTISQSTSKEERQNAVKMPICGNVKVFWREEIQYNPGPGDGPEEYDSENGAEDDIPF